eukprot:CAMPEP_0202688636 /NCGR_PEP_ID=MMETSP1385-20130828/4124_1 /ASSEMBLY_ACC=CAM_ASM_000861 /TAXON_ID=933848 /ORGANISM="Elphidium margaritaceum" /LENGTH=308 /DNA_ID=CAMNT_0049343655 /DNA_START=158 /DNA_END=1084 /DNA_ORIENTATION=-
MSWKQIFTFSGVAVAGFLYLIYSQQEKILYLNETIPPKRTSENPAPYANPKQSGLDYEDVWFTTKDNHRLHAWWIPFTSRDDRTAPTLVFYHANAGNMGFRLPNLVAIHEKLNMNIFIISYRGYGESEGIPGEDGMKMDAVEGIQYLWTHKQNEMDAQKIFLFGRSLGGAVAVATAYALEHDQQLENAPRIAGLILENTFSSISDMVGKVFPFLDFAWIKKYMLRIHWRSIELIPSISSNLLFLACDHDEIVPHQQMVTLYEAAQQANTKQMFVIEGGTHNDGWMKGGDAYWQKIREFVQTSTPPSKL